MLLMYAGDLFVNMMTFASLQRYPSSSSLTCKGGGGGHSLIFVQKSTCMWHCKVCGFRDLETPQGVQFHSSVS